MSEYKCNVCGKYKDDDVSFNIKNMMCNKHMIQVKRYGKPLDNLPSIDKSKRTKICSVCGVVDERKSYYWLKEGEYYGKELCGKHYNQMSIHGIITDSSPTELKSREPIWTDAELNTLRECYSKYMSLKEIAVILNRTEHAISVKAQRLGLCDEYIRKNNSHFKDIYQDYDWLKERYINKLMTPEEIAIEANTTPRTIRKWCERHKLYQNEAKRAIHLTDLQYDLIMFSLLGDGHIDKRETQPIFIISHAENQKDYLFWKYNILKNICNSEPSFIKESITQFGDRLYECQSNYRISTRIIDELIPIRSMSKSDIINHLTEFGLAIHFLDDASCDNDSLWTLCYAAFTEEEKGLYRKILKERFGIEARLRKDNRYIGFSKPDSKKISEIILRNIPNNLDIIKYKILEKGVA